MPAGASSILPWVPAPCPPRSASRSCCRGSSPSSLPISHFITSPSFVSQPISPAVICSFFHSAPFPLHVVYYFSIVLSLVSFLPCSIDFPPLPHFLSSPAPFPSLQCILSPLCHPRRGRQDGGRGDKCPGAGILMKPGPWAAGTVGSRGPVSGRAVKHSPGDAPGASCVSGESWSLAQAAAEPVDWSPKAPGASLPCAPRQEPEEENTFSPLFHPKSG